MIFPQLSEQLNFLRQLLEKITPGQYTYKSQYLSGASIGGHTRHILELLGCAVHGYPAATVDYQNRSRNMALEVEVGKALELLHELDRTANKPDISMQLLGHGEPVPTSYHREIVYNIEHAIHHLALIKVCLLEVGFPDIDQHFGMAYSTIKFKQEQVAVKS